MFGNEQALVNVLNTDYTADEQNLAGHQRIVDQLISLGVSKRTSKTASSSLIPPDWGDSKGSSPSHTGKTATYRSGSVN